MLQRIDLRDEEGFTLIELMMVVLILGTILLMSMSTMRGIRERALDTAAKESAASALETGRILFTDHATYSDVTTVELGGAEPAMDFVDEVTNSSGPGESSTWVPDRATTGHIFVAAVYSKSGKCFYVRDWITLGIGFAVVEDVPASDCTADSAVPPTVSFWGSTWPTV
jgi:prepilin-type N-terminal cleavage/methylation domain-containing protein